MVATQQTLRSSQSARVNHGVRIKTIALPVALSFGDACRIGCVARARRNRIRFEPFGPGEDYAMDSL